jgi:ParB-like chromosome segregation protein Spo0J
LNPLLVRPNPDTEKYEILAGVMRALALRAAGKTHAECTVVDECPRPK